MSYIIFVKEDHVKVSSSIIDIAYRFIKFGYFVPILHFHFLFFEQCAVHRC